MWGWISIERFLQDLSFALRSLRKNVVFSAVAIARFALGIGANTAIFSTAATFYRILREHMRLIAVVGRLRISEERAGDLVHASGCGTVLTLLSMPEGSRDTLRW